MSKPVDVLIWADLPAHKKIPDLEVSGRRKHGISKIRCQARARGDTQEALHAGVPEDGGYRCRGPVQQSGLCWRHHPNATPEVRARALELHRREYPNSPIWN